MVSRGWCRSSGMVLTCGLVLVGLGCAGSTRGTETNDSPANAADSGNGGPPPAHNGADGGPPPAHNGADGGPIEGRDSGTVGGGDGDGDGDGDGRDAGGAPAPGDHGPSFPAVTDFGAKGPFAVTKDDRSTNAELGTADCTVYRPSELGENGLKHPVIIWGNGTGTPTVIVYEWLFKQWASHGFIVAAANTSSAGTGEAMLRCLDWVEQQDKVAGGPYEQHVALSQAGTSGHSQGGGGSIMAGRDPRIRASVPFMAYTTGLGHDATSQSQQHGPMLLMSGSADTIAPPDTEQKPAFDSSNVPTFWGVLAGADHVSFALGGIKGYLAPSTAWFRLHLMGDESARSMFYGTACTLCGDAKWMVQRKDID